MLVDTKGITKDLEGRVLHISFSDGSEETIRLEAALSYDCHAECNGFVYKVLSTNRPQMLERMKREHPGGFSCWGKFEDVVSWKLAEASGS
jgi:hypothetical protein